MSHGLIPPFLTKARAALSSEKESTDPIGYESGLVTKLSGLCGDENYLFSCR
jgi:hypothetical protein